MYPLASSQGRFCLSKKINDDKGQNSSTCDPWTARDFMEDMRLNSAQCEHCLSGIYSFLVSVLELVWKTSVQYVTAF